MVIGKRKGINGFFLLRYLISSMDPEHLINKKNRHGYTALYCACKNGHLNVFLLFL